MEKPGNTIIRGIVSLRIIYLLKLSSRLRREDFFYRGFDGLKKIAQIGKIREIHFIPKIGVIPWYNT